MPIKVAYEIFAMDKKFVLNRYAHYYEYLQTIGKMPLTQSVTIESINPNRGLLQSCYKEIGVLKKEIGASKFDVNLIDYLCWISAQYIIDRAGNTNLAEYLKNNYDTIKEDSNNLLRLASKKPEFFDDSKDILMMWHDNYMKEIKSAS